MYIGSRRKQGCRRKRINRSLWLIQRGSSESKPLIQSEIRLHRWLAGNNKYLENIIPICLCCFLNVFIKIRDRSRKKYKEIFNTVADKIWNCCKAESESSFSQRVRRLYEWAKNEMVPDVILKLITKMKTNISNYSKAYDLPGCHRTSNMIDRQMQRTDRHLFSTFYFHGNLA